MIQFVLTPAAGKRLIAKAVIKLPPIQAALKSGVLVIVAGTTNGYVAEEILEHLGKGETFTRKRFFRGITLPPSRPAGTPAQPPGDEGEFPGDLIIAGGTWQKGKTIFDVADNLKEGDVILKGANAVDLTHRRAAILVGHPNCGTIGAALLASIGRRVNLILPVGVEKRVPGDLDVLARKLNAPGAQGPRLFPVPGEIVTEIDAIPLLTGARAEIIAAGGVCGAEGAVWLSVSGDKEQEDSANRLLHSIGSEPLFSL